MKGILKAAKPQVIGHAARYISAGVLDVESQLMACSSLVTIRRQFSCSDRHSDAGRLSLPQIARLPRCSKIAGTKYCDATSRPKNFQCVQGSGSKAVSSRQWVRGSDGIVHHRPILIPIVLGAYIHTHSPSFTTSLYNEEATTG